MATSTFERNFSVTPDKADEFLNEMSRSVPPTLDTDFHSRLVNLKQDDKFRKALHEALLRQQE